MPPQRQPTSQSDSRLSPGSSLYFTVQEVAGLFRVSTRTVFRWVHDGLLQCRYQFFGGSFYRRVFLAEEIGKLIDEYLPSQDDLECEHPPGPRKQRVEAIKRLRGMSRLFAGKARATKLSKRLTAAYGITEAELDNENAEPATPDRVSSRRGSNYPDRPSISDRSDEGWDEDVEGKA
ncbi:MAG: helix-turn-helix domain-containing protein [Deltaproteobacteria bacterium]|nr:helix-turn-helix domain-containing protein [Deltaproteobacteria bacterium]